MKLSDLFAESAGVGKIVKGVNTTNDVGPNEIQKQAAKFKMTVDANGNPPVANTNGELNEKRRRAVPVNRPLWRKARHRAKKKYSDLNSADAWKLAAKIYKKMGGEWAILQ